MEEGRPRKAFEVFMLTIIRLNSSELLACIMWHNILKTGNETDPDVPDTRSWGGIPGKSIAIGQEE